METKEIKIAIKKAIEIGSYSAKNNLPRTPAKNLMFNDFLKSFTSVEIDSKNIKIVNKLMMAFADAYTYVLIIDARVKLLSK